MSILARKLEIQEKLEERKLRSKMINDSLVEADKLTNNMVSILNQFDERLHKLENTVLPLHRKTKDLQRLQDNIEQTVKSLDHVISYHHTALDVEAILRQGPSGQVVKYLKCMGRLVEAIDFFSENNPDSPELNTVKTLYKNGKERLEKEFQTQLSRQSKPILPVRLLEIIEEELLSVNSTDYFHEKTVNDLALMASWLYSPGNSEVFSKCYSEIRSKNVLTSLDGLKTYVKTFTSNTGARKVSTVLNTPKKSGIRRARTFDKRKDLGKASYIPIAEEEVVDLETESFLKMVAAGAKLLKGENLVVQSIIPDKCKGSVFDEIVTKPLEELEQSGKRFIAFAKQCIATRDHPSVVSIFPAIYHLKQMSSTYHDILKSCSELNHMKVPRLIAELEGIGMKVLDDFTDCVRSDPDKESNMPKDGTVHELTSNTMLFMQQLSQNADVAGSMIAVQQMESQQSPEATKRCLSQYISDVLAALKLNLENKSRVYLDNSLTAIFLLNNYHFILCALDRHGLLGLVEIATSNIQSIYSGIIEEQKLVYIRCWNKFHIYLSNEQRGVTINAQPGNKLKDKEKQIVKDKFKSFNTEFDDLIKTQQQWAIPNGDVKRELRDMVKQKIVPEYTALCEKYRMVQFTKNIEKYLKYTADEVNQNIEKLFDQSSS